MSAPAASETRDLLDFALRLATAAEQRIMPHFRTCATELKDDGSEVTVADRAAEEAIRDLIARHLPDHEVLGEELGGPLNATAEYCWVVDPIDGTTYFALGAPMFGTLVSLLQNGEPLLGVVHFPALNETVYAGAGLGCWFRAPATDPIPVRVAEPVPLARAFVSSASVHASDILSTPGEPSYRLGRVIRAAGKFRFLGDCLQHALLCRGRIHVGIDAIMRPWDVAALIPCLREAGGGVSTLDGRQENLVFGGSLLASCDPALHQEVVALLAPESAG